MKSTKSGSEDVRKHMISIKLINGGKQSILSYNQSDRYDGYGYVVSTLNKRVRVPVNYRIREKMKMLAPYLLELCGYLGDSEQKWEDLLNLEKLVQSLDVTYCYWHEGVLSLGGVLIVLDGYSSVKVGIEKLSSEKVSYSRWGELRDHLDSLMEEVSDWEFREAVGTKDQLALDFLSIEEDLSADQAKKLFEGMSLEDREEILGKHLLKYTEAVDDMMGNDSGDDLVNEGEEEVGKADSGFVEEDLSLNGKEGKKKRGKKKVKEVVGEVGDTDLDVDDDFFDSDDFDNVVPKMKNIG